MTEHDDEHPNPWASSISSSSTRGRTAICTAASGAHPDEDGTWFAVWAPTAKSVRGAR